MLNKDIISPEIPYATFSDELINGTPERLTAYLNFGEDMFSILSTNDLFYSDPVKTVEVIQKIRKIYNAHLHELSKIRRVSDQN